MSWNSNIITVWLPYYLSKYLGVKTTALSFTAVPYVVNSLFSICNKTKFISDKHVFLVLYFFKLLDI